MKRFWTSLIEPIFVQLQPRTIIEIGSFRGANTERLLTYCQANNATLHTIDPRPAFDVDAWQATYGDRFVPHLGKSHDVLPGLVAADLVLIDGDHNWYTVYHELKLIDESADRHGCPFPVVLFHDIGWPYARRDMYYNPDDIPLEWRQLYEKRGVLPGKPGLQESGFNPELHNAAQEHGPRNGVLTAVEDFMRERETPLTLIMIEGFSGLGILYPDSIAERAPELNDHLARLKTGNELLSAHLQALESRRIANQLKLQELRQRIAELEALTGTTSEGGRRRKDRPERHERRR